jgi:hypothetical protein
LGDRLLPQKISEKTSNAEYEMPQHTAKTTMVQEPSISAATVEKSPSLEKKIRAQQNTESKSRLAELESKEFRLDLRGTALLGSSHISKDVSMTLKMRPVPGSNLEAFSVYDAKLVLASTAIDMKNVRAEVTGQKMSLTVVSDSVGTFVIVVNLDEPILTDNNNRQNVSAENQLFYLVNKDLPYKLNLGGTLSS